MAGQALPPPFRALRTFFVPESLQASEASGASSLTPCVPAIGDRAPARKPAESLPISSRGASGDQLFRGDSAYQAIEASGMPAGGTGSSWKVPALNRPNIGWPG